MVASEGLFASAPSISLVRFTGKKAIRTGRFEPWNLWSTLWLFNIAMENGPFIDDFPIKTSIYKGSSMAMLNNQRVPIKPLVN